MTGDHITIATEDGDAEAYVSTPGIGGHPGVLLYMDAIGLRPQIYAMADRIAAWGYTVLAPNVFHREGRIADLAPQSDLRVPAHREAFVGAAMARVAALTPDLTRRDAPAYVRRLAEMSEGSRIGVHGYCMGGALSVRTAAAVPDAVASVASFHGGRLVTDAPDSPHRLVEGTDAAYLFIHADQDPSMTKHDVEVLDSSLQRADLDHTSRIEPGASHGFTMADTAPYHPEAAERHFTDLRSHLARHLAGAAG